MLRALNGSSLGDGVFEQVCAEIISGELVVGSRLPSERDLSAVFGVNRHVVRGAIQRLEQIGLVRVGRARTEVLDYQQHAGLDVLYTLTRYAQGRNEVLRMWLSTLQLRATIGTDVLRLCALNPDDSYGERLRTQAALMRDEADDLQLRPLWGVFWDVALDGAGSLAYRMAFNGLLATVDAQPSESAAFVREELEADRYHADIVAGVLAHDGDATERAARSSLRHHLGKYEAALRAAEGPMRNSP